MHLLQQQETVRPSEALLGRVQHLSCPGQPSVHSPHQPRSDPHRFLAQSGARNQCQDREGIQGKIVKDNPKTGTSVQDLLRGERGGGKFCKRIQCDVRERIRGKSSNRV